MASPSRSRSRKKKMLLSGTRTFLTDRAKNMRSAARRANKTSKQLKAGFDASTGQQYCVPCKKWIPSNGWAAHVASHSLANGQEKPGDRRPETEPVRAAGNSERDKERRRRSAEPDVTPPKKEAWKNRRERDRKTKHDLDDADTKTAQNWDERQRKVRAVADGSNNGAMPPICGAVAERAVAWGQYMPATREEAELFLFGSSNMFKVIADSARNISANFIAAKLHPAVARPIDDVADVIEEERLAFTRSYVILCRIYRPRIEYEDSDGPKPDDAFWKAG